MGHKKDYEAEIIQKLDNMIDLAEAFKLSLEGTPEEKGARAVSVYSPATGELFWYSSDRELVREGWEIGVVQVGVSLVESEPVVSPADGSLSIMEYGGRVRRGEKIAEIEIDVLV